MRAAWRTIAATVLLAGVVVPVAASRASADTPAGFSTALVLGGLDAGDGGAVTAFAYAPDGRIFVARKQGIVDVYDGGVQRVFLDLSDEVNSVQGRGLLGLTVDPAFATNHKLYALFTQELDPEDPNGTGPAGGEIVSVQQRAADPDAADLSTRVTLLSGYNEIATQHTVGALRFDAAGNLLASFGDASDLGVNDGAALAALDLDDLRGKIIRIDPTTGSGVPGNPYYDAGAPDSVRSKVYVRGMRNAFRFSVDPDNGTVYAGDVGWTTWEMLNAFPTAFTDADKDRDGGWPCYEGGDGVALPQPDFEYSPVTQAACDAIYPPALGGTGVGVAAPRYGYRHDEPSGENGSAIIGGPKYDGTSNYPAQYVGQLFIGDFSRDRLQTVDPDTGTATDFGTPGDWGNPVDIQIAPDGNVAYLGIGSSELREIVYTASDHPPVAVADAAQTSSATAPFTAQFDGSQSSDPDAGDTLTYDWNFADGSPDSNLVSPAHEYVNAGSYLATLTVSDGHPGGTASSSVWIDVVNTPPKVTLSSPPEAYRYKVGDVVDIALDARDAEDGQISGAQVSTQVDLVYPDHSTPVTNFAGVDGSFTVADAGSDLSHYEVDTTVTDAAGRPTTSPFEILPDTQPVSITSTPPGAAISVDGVAATTPFTFASIVGGHHDVVAPTGASPGGAPVTFDGWTAGSATANTQSYAFATPANGATVTAAYSPTAKGISISDDSIEEGRDHSRTVTLDVALSAPQTSPVTVDYTTVDGSGRGAATAPSDYTAASGTVTFAAGATDRTITVSVNGDRHVEGDQHFDVVLSNAQGAPIVRDTGAVTILDDDPGAGLRLAVGDAHVLEGSAGEHDAHITVSLSAPSPGGVTVDYTTADATASAPSDYSATAGSLTFAAGATAQTIVVPVNGDGAFEPGETFAVDLSDAIGAAVTRAVGTVRVGNDDEGPALSVGNVATVEGNSGTRTVAFTISLSTPSDAIVTVDWEVSHQTTNDGDVRRKQGIARIRPGKQTAIVQVVSFGDTTVEPDETYAVTLSSAVNATISAATAVGTIVDDDPSSALAVNVGDAAIAEGNSGNTRVEVTVSLSDPAPNPVTVDYASRPGSASRGSDFAGKHGTLTIAAGATTAFITIVVHGDAAPEPDETFTVRLARPTGGARIGRAMGTETIVNDD